MDNRRFDGMAKKLATVSSRRWAVGGLAAAGAGWLATRAVGAASEKAACAASCNEQFPEASKGVRRKCVSACVQALESGKSQCAVECKEAFPEASKGVRRGCVKACVQASEEAA